MSGTAAIRADAVLALAQTGDLGPVEAALTDRTPIVRAAARPAMRRAGVDPAACYRGLVTMTAPDSGALAGLGETGSARDAVVVASSLAYPRTRGRAEAVRPLRRLGAGTPSS